MCFFKMYTTHILLHYLSITLSNFTAVARTPPPHSPSLASGCGCSGCSGGLGPEEAEKGSTAVLSLWLPAPSPPPHLMNNGREKYILSFNSPSPLAETVQSGPNRHSTGLSEHPPTPCHTTPPIDCLCSF